MTILYVVVLWMFCVALAWLFMAGAYKLDRIWEEQQFLEQLHIARSVGKSVVQFPSQRGRERRKFGG